MTFRPYCSTSIMDSNSQPRVPPYPPLTSDANGTRRSTSRTDYQPRSTSRTASKEHQQKANESNNSNIVQSLSLLTHASYCWYQNTKQQKPRTMSDVFFGPVAISRNELLLWLHSQYSFMLCFLGFIKKSNERHTPHSTTYPVLAMIHLPEGFSSSLLLYFLPSK
jgi:hypothetical protein